MDILLICLSVVTIILLIALIGSVKKISSLGRGEKQVTYPATAAQPVQAVHPGVSPEVIAAITAAIASVWEGETGFVVRHIKRVSNAPAWNRAGREDQIYSRL